LFHSLVALLTDNFLAVFPGWGVQKPAASIAPSYPGEVLPPTPEALPG